MKMTTPSSAHKHDGKRQQILEQISYFESRLEEMGGSGDCAYEKSLVRVYETRLSEQRQILQGLEG
jgi:hypothetical protein